MITSPALQLRRAFFPLTERTFTYARYEALLDDLADENRFRVVPLCELPSAADADRAVVVPPARRRRAARSRRGLRAAGARARAPRDLLRPPDRALLADGRLIPTLLRMQNAFGHEIGWHNDLVTLKCVLGADARMTLASELERLRGAGLRIVGTSSHGSPACYRYGFHNGYFFSRVPVEGSRMSTSSTGLAVPSRSRTGRSKSSGSTTRRITSITTGTSRTPRSTRQARAGIPTNST